MIVILQRVYGNLIYVVPAFLILSLWLLNSQRQVFMKKLDECMAELEGRKNHDEDKTCNKAADEMDMDDAEIERIRRKELVEEMKRGKLKLG